ncbi:MAG TPA: hypothetical protein DCZ94_21125 [Lentisphaeria bacterium]|nr:MAG: hypothetical protein A2X48_16640 [Lentisphaerae bacterium GWF2_49_21]HBC89448.1 hypothetical protein [Lentisphaeria bacterium]
MKVAGYIRVSTQEQVREGESLTTQKDEICRYVKQKGWELVKIYADEGKSGSKVEHRHGFLEMINDGKKKHFEGIIFTRLSRFARNARDYLTYQELLKEYGIRLFSIHEGIDPTTNTGKLMMGLMALIAEWEREAIREQMAENKMSKWGDHRTFIGHPPYGYKWNKETSKLEINPKQAEIYKRMVNMYLNLGMSLRSIAVKLKEDGVLCKKRPFSSITVSYAFKNPAYYGHYVLNRHEYKIDPITGRHHRTKILKPESSNIIFPIPAIISKGQWDKIQEKTTFNRVKSKRSEASSLYWLRDLLVCDECGGVVKPHHGKYRKDKTFPRYYSCYWSAAAPQVLILSNKKKKCPLPFCKAEDLEDKVWFRIIQPLMLPYNRNKSMGSLLDTNKYDKEISSIKEHLKRLKDDLKRKEKASAKLYSIFEDDGFDKNELKHRLSAIKNDMLGIESEIKDKEEKIELLETAKNNDHLIHDFVRKKDETLKRMFHDLRDLPPEDKKRYAESMINGKITIAYETWGNKVRISPQFHLRYNEEILQQLINEGKLGKSNKYSRNSFSQHRFSSPGRADHQNIMAASRCDLDGPFCIALALDLVEVRVGPVL